MLLRTTFTQIFIELYILLSIYYFSIRCADPGGSPCQYDEGSPLVQDFVDPDTLNVTSVAVGIFSKNKMCTYPSLEAISIYTRLSAFDSWLRNTAGQQPVHP